MADFRIEVTRNKSAVGTPVTPRSEKAPVLHAGMVNDETVANVLFVGNDGKRVVRGTR